MFRLSTIRRRLLLGAGSLLLLSGLSLIVVHTRLVRRFVLIEAQTRLGNALGVVIDAKDLEYNLFSSWFELHDVRLKGRGPGGMPVPIAAQRVELVLPVWRLIRGSFDTARIRIDGLSVNWFTNASGQTNWPAIPSPSSSGNGGGGPAVLVSGGEMCLQDERSGLVVRLPLRQISGAWDAALSRYRIGGMAGGGLLRWNGLRRPLDLVQFQSAISGSGVLLDSLQIVSGKSGVRATASLAGSPARLEAVADVDGDLHEFTDAAGRVQARISAGGPIEALQLAGVVRGQQLVIGGTPINRPEAELIFDVATSQLRIQRLSGGVSGAQLSGNGSLAVGNGGGRSQIKASIRNLKVLEERTAVELDAAWPGLDWKHATVSGVARSNLGEVGFKALGQADSVRTALDAKLRDGESVHGDVTFGLSDHKMTGVLHGTAESLAPLTGIDGAARFSASLAGTIEQPSAAIQLEASGLSTGAWAGVDLRLQANYADNRFAIDQANLTWQGQRLLAAGEITGTTPDAPLRLQGTVEGHAMAGVEGAVSGTVQVSGTLAHPIAEASLRAPSLDFHGERLVRAGVDASWQNGQVNVTRLFGEQEHDSDPPGRFEANGCFDPVTGRYQVAAQGQDFRPAALSGTFQFEAHGEGTLNDPVFSVRLNGRDVAAAEKQIGELHASIDTAAHRATAVWSLPDLNARGASTIALEGALPFDLSLDARGTRLETTSFDAAVHANGTLAPFQLQGARAAIDNLQFQANGQQIAGDGPIQVDYSGERIKVAKLALRSGASVVRVSGELPVRDAAPAGSLSVEGRLDLAPVSASLVGGVAEVTASITGSVNHWLPAGSVTIHEAQLHWAPLPFPVDHITGRFDLQDGVVRFDGLNAKAGNGALRVNGSVPLTFLSDALPAPSEKAGRTARLSAQLEKLEVAGGSGDQAVTATIAAKLEAEAASPSLAAVRGSIEFTDLEANSRTSQLRQASPTRITFADGLAHLENCELTGPDASLKAKGSMALDRESPFELEAAGQANLSFLSLVAPEAQAGGNAQIDVRARGTLNAPEVAGFVKLDRASLLLQNPRIQASNIKLSAALNGDAISVKEFTGFLNGGTFTGGGDLKLGTSGLRDVNLFLKGKDVYAEYPASVKTTSSVDVKLVSKEEGLALTGQIEIQEGYHESAIDLFSSSGQTFTPAPESAPARGSKPVALDIKIVTKQSLEMNNNLGRLSATADLRLTGDVNHVGLLGTLDLEQDGRIYFGDRTYYIERGTVRFLDQTKITPSLNIQAYTLTGDYTIRLGLSGEPNEITTTFTSDPPLARDDVIAVLLTGKTVAENRGVDLRALEATSLATGAMNASLSSELHRTLGISRVSIQPSAVAAESNPGARITVTQDLTNSLRLLYSINLSDSNDQIWIGEYDLSRSFTTRLVKQSDNTYRGEFRHDIRFGRSGPAADAQALRAPVRRISQVRFAGTGPFRTEDMAKIFKLKPGQKYRPIKARKGAERLTKFLTKKGYLESRVRLDREDDGHNIALTVRVHTGPILELAYNGAKLPKRQRSQMRKTWHAGISDQQRPDASKEALLAYYAGKGFLQAQVDLRIDNQSDPKTVQFDLRPGPRYRGVKVVVDGASPQHAKPIRSLISGHAMKVAVYRDPGRVVQAINGYYQHRGYLSAKVSPPLQQLDQAHRTGRVLIRIAEGPIFHVSELQFSGNEALDDAGLRTGVPLEAGGVFEPSRVEPTLVALKQKYGKLGYRDATVEYSLVRHDDRALVDVTFDIVEHGQTSIGTIAVEGNRHTSDKFALGRLKVAAGEVANTEEIRDSVKSLAQTGAYTSADVQLQPPVEAGAGDKRVQVADVVVAVTEPKPFRLLYGGLYDSGNGPGFIGDLQMHNSLGPGRTMGLRIREDSETDEARLYLTQPFWGLKTLSTTVATYYTREVQYHQTKPTETLGVSIQQDYQLRSKWLLSYGYRFERQRGFVPDPAAPDIPATVVSVAPLTLTFSRDARDSFLDATRGSFISHGFEFAPRFLGSDYPYVRYYLQYFKYFPLTHPRPVPFGDKPLRSRLVFATGYRMGLQKGFDETGAVLTDRFYAGGGTTVRGFHQDELGPRLASGQPAGGNAVLVINQELRYPLFWIFDAVTFLDVGNVYPRVADFRFSELRSATGFGLRLRNPFVVLRFDYGFKLGRRPGESLGAFFFSIGQAF